MGRFNIAQACSLPSILLLLLVQRFQFLLGAGIVVLRRGFQPLARGSFVFLDSIAGEITRAQRVLRPSGTLFGVVPFELDGFLQRLLFGLFRVGGRRRSGNRVGCATDRWARIWRNGCWLGRRRSAGRRRFVRWRNNLPRQLAG